jgi:hypothetical protein
MDGEVVGVIISLGLSFLTVVGGVVLILAALRYRLQVRELRHRERLAMIDKGLMPPPEFEPQVTFNRGVKQRSLSFGIVVVGLGFALMLLIGIAGGALDSGVGIGGAVAILGLAFIVRSFFAPPPPPAWHRGGGPPPATPPPEPPSDTIRP